MATAGNLVATIIRDLARSDLSISDIVLIDIQSSIRDYEAYRFYFNERKLSLTLSATNTYALSLWVANDATLGDIIEIDNVTVLVNTNTRRYMLTEVPYESLRDADYGPGLPTGNPERYAIYQQSLVLDTFPSPAITGTLDCHVKFADTVSLSASNVWTNDARELIRNAALKRLWGRHFANPDQAQIAGVGEQGALAALQRRTDALSGHIIAGYL